MGTLDENDFDAQEIPLELLNEVAGGKSRVPDIGTKPPKRPKGSNSGHAAAPTPGTPHVVPSAGRDRNGF